MARGRMLDRSIKLSKKIANTSRDGQWLYFRMLPFTDDHGKTYGDIEDIKAEILPKETIIESKITALLMELHANNLVMWAVNEVCEFVDWKKHQNLKGRPANSQFPDYQEVTGKGQERSEKVKKDSKRIDSLSSTSLPLSSLKDRGSGGKNEDLDFILSLFDPSYFSNMTIPNMLLDVDKKYGKDSLRAVVDKIIRSCSDESKRNGPYVRAIIESTDLAGIKKGTVNKSGGKLEWLTRIECATRAESDRSGKATDEIYSVLKDGSGNNIKFPDDHRSAGQTVWVKR